MSAICCPHCGGVLFAVGAGDGQAPAAPLQRSSPSPSAAAPAQRGDAETALEVRYGDGWELQCSEHGWRKARLFESNGRAPAVVKCTARRDDGSYCAAKIPLGEARRRAGMSDGMTRDG